MKSRMGCKAGLFLAVFFLAGSLAFAQGSVSGQAQRPSGSQAQPVRKTILDYKSDLKLTDKQSEQIKADLFDLENKDKDLQSKLSVANREIRALLANNGDMKQISDKIKESYSIQAEATIAQVETGRKIDAVLSKEQSKKWKEIISKQAQRMQAAAK